MPRKRIFHKRTKRAKSIRSAWLKKKQFEITSTATTTDSQHSSEGNELEEPRGGGGEVTQHFEIDYEQGTPVVVTAHNVNSSGSSQNKRIPEDVKNDSDEESDYAPLVIERVPYDNEEINLAGRRMVDINHLLHQIRSVAMHPTICTMGKYKLKKEFRNGLFSKWTFYCDNCEKEFIVTSVPFSQKEEVNDALAWSAMSVGVGYSQLEELFSILDIPIISHKKYKSHENKVGQSWDQTLSDMMKKNAEEEKRIAIEKGNLLNGMPFITVIGDGGWAKQTYGHGMNSLSGVVGVTTLLLVFLVSPDDIAPDQEKKSQVSLRGKVYSHLDKLCRDVNNLDKIQIAIYFMMQSWMNMCDTTPNTLLWAPLKLMKKKIHTAVTKKIHEFNKREERTVEDCVIVYYKTEIVDTKDDFHQLLFELVLQGYVNTFNDTVDNSDDKVKMETINCTNSDSCRYSFKIPPKSSNMFDTIVKKNVNESAVNTRERKCVQIFQYLYLWNEKIRHPEAFDWAYYLIFRGLKTNLNMTVEEIKQHLRCSSTKMEEMEEAMTSKESEIEQFLLNFLRERDGEIEVLEDEIEYASESEKVHLKDQLNLQTVLAELMIKTYMSLLNVTPDNGKLNVRSATGKEYEIDVPSMDHIPML